MEILDIYGNIVKSIVDKELSLGTHSTYYWEGVDNSGRKVSSGTYICRLTAGDNVRTRKVTVAR